MPQTRLPPGFTIRVEPAYEDDGRPHPASIAFSTGGDEEYLTRAQALAFADELRRVAEGMSEI